MFVIPAKSNSSIISIEKLDDNSSEDLHINVIVKGEGYSGVNSSVWLFKQDILIFINQLKIIDAKRSGESFIASMSPNDFYLKVLSLDNLGHFGVTVHLSRNTYINSKSFNDLCEITFKIEASFINSIVDYFQVLVQNKK